MERNETQKILALLKVNYTNSFNRLSQYDVDTMITLWNEMLIDYSYKEVHNAIKSIMTSPKEFAPNVGQVINEIHKLRDAKNELIDEHSAWQLVHKAICNSGYRSQEEFEKLPPIVRKIVGSPRQLYEWCMMDSKTVNSVVASNFMRSYSARYKHEKELMMLPNDIKKMLGVKITMIEDNNLD